MELLGGQIQTFQHLKQNSITLGYPANRGSGIPLMPKPEIR